MFDFDVFMLFYLKEDGRCVSFICVVKELIFCLRLVDGYVIFVGLWLELFIVENFSVVTLGGS